MFQKCSYRSFAKLSPCVELACCLTLLLHHLNVSAPVAGEVLFVPRLFCSWCGKKRSCMVDGKYLRIKTSQVFQLRSKLGNTELLIYKHF